MFSFLKSKLTGDKPRTLKTRVELFWKWYAEVAPRFFETIEAKKCDSLAEEVRVKVDEFFPGFAWVFGPGENGQGHSFTLTGEGNRYQQFVTLYWLSQAPEIPGWTFYASRQPGSIKGHVIEIGERRFDPIEFWITPRTDLEEEKVDITVWHPMFDTLPERDQWNILFLFLDEVLGEYGTQQFIGTIEMNNGSLAESIPMVELLAYVQGVREAQGWKHDVPGQVYTVYRYDEDRRHDRHLRGDIVVGSTSLLQLVDDYAKSEGELTDPLVGTGADLVFVAFDVSILPDGNQANARGDIEDALDAALGEAKNGRVLGGAHGTQNAYIDLMLYNGTESLKLVTQVLKERKLPAETEIHFFAKEKRGHRIVL